MAAHIRVEDITGVGAAAALSELFAAAFAEGGITALADTEDRHTVAAPYRSFENWLVWVEVVHAFRWPDGTESPVRAGPYEQTVPWDEAAVVRATQLVRRVLTRAGYVLARQPPLPQVSSDGSPASL